MHHRRRGRHEQDLEQRCSDHHAGRHAEQVDHRRNQDEAAADSHQHRQQPRREAQRERCERRDVEPRSVEAPAQRQRGQEDVMPFGLRRRGIAASQRGQARHRLMRHHHADAAEQEDVEQRDDGIDLPALLQRAKRDAAHQRPDRPARDQHHPHLEIDAAALAVREHARHARPGDLRRGRGDGDRRRDAVEDKQRRRQETAAHAEHARKDADQRPQPHDHEDVHRKAGDRQIQVHGAELAYLPLAWEQLKIRRQGERRARSRLRIAGHPNPPVDRAGHGRSGDGHAQRGARADVEAARARLRGAPQARPHHPPPGSATGLPTRTAPSANRSRDRAPTIPAWP